MNRSREIIWITGAGGLIGQALTSRLHRDFDVRLLHRHDLDRSNVDSLRTLHQQEQPSAIVHCAAVSRQPDCEADPLNAQRINVELTRVLACLDPATRLVFLSTDQVFDGSAAPYREGDRVNPKTVYGRTKAEAEGHVLAHSQHTVLRLALTGGVSREGNRAFNEQLRIAWAAGKTVTLFRDEFRTPLWAPQVADVVAHLLERRQPGLFHVGGNERLSRLEMGEAIAARWGSLNPRIAPGSLADYSGPPRCPDTSLDCSRLEAVLGLRLLGFRAWLKAHPDSAV